MERRVVEVVAPELRHWAMRAIAKVGARVPRVETQRRRKLLLVHLDGVPYALLHEGIRSGRMPFLRSLVQSGTYAFDPAFWGSPASTPCFQAGLLYGHRHANLPAYGWWDRELGRQVKMSVPADTALIERRIEGTARGSLLEDGGRAYLSLFSGRGSNLFCMSGLIGLKRVVASLRPQLRGLSSFARKSAAAYLRDLWRQSLHAGRDIFRWARHLHDWRHEGMFLFNQLVVISLAWELAQRRALMDMVRGVPAIYLVFGNYDEVAHRRGPRSEQATAHLFSVDAKLAELYAVARTVPEPYDLYFVTDHGHVDATPFEQRTGRSIQEFLGSAEPAQVPRELVRALLDGRPPLSESEEPVPQRDQLVDAGNFAHLYLTRERVPLEAREILSRHRGLLAKVITHPDIGIVALRRGSSAVAIAAGRLYTAREALHAPLPAGFSRRALADLLEELPHMSTAGDLVLYGQSVKDNQATVGFAWEFGSHGGLTYTETDSLVCWPTDAPLSLSGLSHASQLYDRLSEVYRN